MKIKFFFLLGLGLLLLGTLSAETDDTDKNLGLPELSVPEDNLLTIEKVQLGDRLYHDNRFSSTGKISCSTCHDQNKGFTDSPLQVSKGIKDFTGTRNSPTVINSAFFTTLFWDGRSQSLVDQALHPFLNPVEMGLSTHEPILEICRSDEYYKKAFEAVFKVKEKEIKIEHVVKAISAFERTVIAGNSRFDRWYYKQEPTLTEQEAKGFNVFITNGRCVSCHTIEYSTALFMDNKFHNIGVGINKLANQEVEKLVGEYLKASYSNTEVDFKVLQDPKVSELGRFAVTKNLTEIGAFKTPTLRNIAITAPYMHDGSYKTLVEVLDHYNRGGASSDKEKITPFLSGGMMPLDLKPEEIENLEAFLKTLTSKKLNNFK